MQYNTKKKKAIMDFFKVYPDTYFTAEQVAVALDDIGRSTIYRVITDLCESGFLTKEYSEEKGCLAYKTDKESCREHFHMKCNMCGRLSHLDSKEMEETVLKITEESGFSVDVRRTVFYGVCENCKRKGNK
ncbi:MAG: transcriptional repressor [Clostridia bacterium]|nr:transcriptional repressor [Clostridia bacterium]